MRIPSISHLFAPTALGFVLILALSYMLARQRAKLREEEMLGRQAEELLSIATRFPHTLSY